MAATGFTGVTDGNGYDATNWDNGLPSDTNDEVRIAESDRAITGIDFAGSGDADIKTFYAGGSFTGSIGSAIEALKFNDFDAYPVGHAIVDLGMAPANQICNFNFTTCPLFIVSNCGTNDHACYISGGSYDRFFVEGGHSIRFATGVTVPLMVIRHDITKPRPLVYLEPGVIVDELKILNGRVRAYGNMGNITVSGGGHLEFLGSGAVTIDALETFGGAAVYCRGNGGTVLTVSQNDNSLIDSASGSSRPWTFDTSNLMGGMFKAKAIDNFTAAPLMAGGSLMGWTGSRVEATQGDPS